VDLTVVGHGAARGDQCLARDLAAEHAWRAVRRADSAEQVHLELFQVEQPHQPVERDLPGYLFGLSGRCTGLGRGTHAGILSGDRRVDV
jgi:hypothetical protein